MDYHHFSNQQVPEESALLLSDSPAEETLVTDARAGLTPAQMVERRLASLLQNGPPPLGSSQHSGPRRAR